jgi:molybdate transport system regulatory protein
MTKQITKQSKKYSIFFRIRIFDDKDHFVGKGRIELLENIQKFGSITKAAADMKMSYRQAWQLVKEMNEITGTPLVEKILGGKGGGGTKVTPMGEKVIKVFHEVHDKIDDFTTQLAKKIKF